MASKQKDKEDITVVAYLRVQWHDGEEHLRQFDRAWIFAQEKANQSLPVKVTLLGFIRKDSPKVEYVIRF